MCLGPCTLYGGNTTYPFTYKFKQHLLLNFIQPTTQAAADPGYIPQSLIYNHISARRTRRVLKMQKSDLN